jgi:hypothetical protein
MRIKQHGPSPVHDILLEQLADRSTSVFRPTLIALFALSLTVLCTNCAVKVVLPATCHDAPVKTHSRPLECTESVCSDPLRAPLTDKLGGMMKMPTNTRPLLLLDRS